MPLLKHAKKKLKQDNKREIERRKIKDFYKAMIKKARLAPSAESITNAYKAIDKAAKIHIIHENKAARLKSSVAQVKEGTASVAAPKAKKQLTKAARAKVNKATTAKAKATKKK